MPRTTIDLAPDQYQFNDQPLLSADIWKAASAIAQAPRQLAQIRMQQEDRTLAQQQAQATRDYQMRHLTMQEKAAQDTREYQMKHLAGQEQAAKDAHAYQMKHLENDALKAAAKPIKDPNAWREKAEHGAALIEGRKLGVYPRPDEDVDAYMARLGEVQALKHNATPAVTPVEVMKSMKPGANAMPAEIEAWNAKTPAQQWGGALEGSEATTPRRLAGGAIKMSQLPGGAALPTGKMITQDLSDDSAPEGAGPVPMPVADKGNQRPPTPTAAPRVVTQGADPVKAAVSGVRRGHVKEDLDALALKDPTIYEQVRNLLDPHHVPPVRQPAANASKMSGIRFGVQGSHL